MRFLTNHIQLFIHSPSTLLAAMMESFQNFYMKLRVLIKTIQAVTNQITTVLKKLHSQKEI